MGNRLLITSEKSQTTRQQLRCILTGQDYQIIFVDTPGLHQPKNKLGEFMLQQILSSVSNSDVVLHVLDATKAQSEITVDYARDKPVILVLNKVDLLYPQQADKLREQFHADGRFADVLAVSAHNRTNLDEVIATIKEYMPAGELLYPADQLMDCDYRLLVAELIREQALLQLEEEVPHGIAVEIISFLETEEEATIQANIIVERQSHKGIVIGKGGSMLKKIGIGARLQIIKLLEKNTHLKLWVKVKKNWRKDSNQLKWLGYK